VCVRQAARQLGHKAAEIAMNANTASAYRRLIALTTIVAIGATFACRPAWSPDSKQVVYPGRIDGKLALARYDVEKQTSEIVMVTPAEKVMLTPYFLSNAELLVLSSKPGDNQPLIVTRMPVGPTRGFKTPGPFEITTDDESADHMVLPPVVVGDQLFLGGKSLTRVDLRNGQTLRRDLPGTPDDVVLSRRGDGICYVTVRDKEHKSQWELGTIDPETLAGKVLMKAPKSTDENPGWTVLPMPSFTKDLKRVALPGERVNRESTEQTQTAILVFHEGKLETVLPLSDIEGDVGVGSIAWAPDNVSLLAVIARKTKEGHRFSLYETTFSGSVTRETALFDAPATSRTTKPSMLHMQLALSPNGKWAAVTTSYMQEKPDRDKALLLVDVSGKERIVKAVPFPKQAAKNH
jgi:hypothetical protein